MTDGTIFTGVCLSTRGYLIICQQGGTSWSLVTHPAYSPVLGPARGYPWYPLLTGGIPQPITGVPRGQDRAIPSGHDRGYPWDRTGVIRTRQGVDPPPKQDRGTPQDRTGCIPLWDRKGDTLPHRREEEQLCGAGGMPLAFT